MSGVRLEIRLDRVHANAALLVERLGARGINVCGVTKASLGSPEIAREMLAAGVRCLGDSRIENVERLRRSGIAAELMLIRAPLPDQCGRVVAAADVSLNSELVTIRALALEARAQGRVHGVILMVELGDLREGMLVDQVVDAAIEVEGLIGVQLRGLGANLACQNGVIPDGRNMAALSALVAEVEQRVGHGLRTVSGGNSTALGWAMDPDGERGRVDELRLGESILLGCDPLTRAPIPGLHTDAFCLVGDVIESKRKPSEPWGERGQAAFGPVPPSTAGVPAASGGTMHRVLVGLGRQDVDPDGLVVPAGYRLLGASSDHLVLEAIGPPPAVGEELRFGVGYAGLLRAMTSPFVARRFGQAPDDESA